MKKIFSLLLVLSVLFLAGCNNNKLPVAKLHKVTVEVTPPDGVQLNAITDLKITATPASGDPIPLTVSGGRGTVELKEGAYTFIVTGEFDGNTLNGSKSENIDSDTDLDVVLTISASGGLIFKELYFSGVKSYYFLDNFYEIYNNSDEVQYLDGLIMAPVEEGFNGMTPGPSLWMSSEYEDEVGNRYPLACAVMYFPGNGTDHPLQPGKSVVVASIAMNHSARELAEGHEKSPVDLSKADWECYYSGFSNPAVVDNPNVPNLEFAYWNSGRPAYIMNTRNGQAMVLARLPKDTSMEDYLADESNYMVRPQGIASVFTFLMIPSEYVIDAVDIVMGASNTRFKKLYDKDDIGMTWISGNEPDTNGEYTGKSLRRKVKYINPDGRVIYQDTNNSSEDFVAGGRVPTPGVHPATVD